MRTRKSTKSSGGAARRTQSARSSQSKRSKPRPQRIQSSKKSKPGPQRKQSTKKKPKPRSRPKPRRRRGKRAQSNAARQRRARRRQAAKHRRQRRTYQIEAKGLQAYAANLLQENLKLPDHSKRCSAILVFTVLLAAAGQCCAIAAACHRMGNAPSEQTIYNALEATLPDYTELERRVNRGLRAHLPAQLRRRKQRLAIDLTLIPYHGEPLHDIKEVYRGQAKHGTSHFHAYASLYVVCHGQRFTVALTRVDKGECMKVVVHRLLHWGRRAGIRPKLLLMDRGFYSVAVIQYLKKAKVPFLMPAVARGRKPKDGQPATGIRAFQILKRGGWHEHTLRSGKRSTKVGIAVYCGNYRGQWKRHGRYAWVYAYWGFEPSSLRWLANAYRTRFGIETSYRQMHQGRIKTTTRCPLRRYLFVAIALILRNLWVWLHWELLSTPRRGQRRLNLERLTFEGLLTLLVHVAHELLGFRKQFGAERAPPAAFTPGAD